MLTIYARVQFVQEVRELREVVLAGKRVQLLTDHNFALRGDLLIFASSARYDKFQKTDGITSLSYYIH